MTNHASVMLHVTKDLSEMKIDTLLGELGRLPGVQQVRLGAGTTSHHLILAEFDSGKISSHELLDHLTGQGIEAQLVGM